MCLVVDNNDFLFSLSGFLHRLFVLLHEWGGNFYLYTLFNLHYNYTGCLHDNTDCKGRCSGLRPFVSVEKKIQFNDVDKKG